MEVRISFDRTDPPAGHLWRPTEPGTVDGGRGGAIEFAGWLGLLRALSDSLGAPADIPPES